MLSNVLPVLHFIARVKRKDCVCVRERERQKDRQTEGKEKDRERVNGGKKRVDYWETHLTEPTERKRKMQEKKCPMK